MFLSASIDENSLQCCITCWADCCLANSLHGHTGLKFMTDLDGFFWRVQKLRCYVICSRRDGSVSFEAGCHDWATLNAQGTTLLFMFTVQKYTFYPPVGKVHAQTFSCFRLIHRTLTHVDYRILYN